MSGFPQVEGASACPEEPGDAPEPIPAIFRKRATSPPPLARPRGWRQPALDLEFAPSPVPPELEARLNIRMLVSGRLRCRTFRTWLTASGHRLARLPRDHEVRRMLDVLEPELAGKTLPRLEVLVDRLVEAGLWDEAIATPAPPSL